MKEKKETLSRIYVDGEEEKLYNYHVDLFFKRGIQKLSASGDLEEPERMVEDFLAAKKTGGYALVFRRKKEVRAVCIVSEEDRRYLLKGFHVAKGCTPEAREKYRKRFGEMVEEHMWAADGYVLEYVWGDEVVTWEQLRKRNGR